MEKGVTELQIGDQLMKLQWYIPLSTMYVTYLARYFEILRKNSTIHETADKFDDVRLRLG